VWLGTRATLYRMKRDTLWSIDRADGATLRERFRVAGGVSVPLWRYQDLDEARRALWANADEAPMRMRRLWALFARLAPGTMPRGLRKFRSMEEANRDREEWIPRPVERLRDERARRADCAPP
jgi:hypothetical protein